MNLPATTLFNAAATKVLNQWGKMRAMKRSLWFMYSVRILLSFSLSLSRAPVLNVFIWHFFWPWSCSWPTDRMMNLMNACKQWPKICDDEIKPFPRLTVGQVIQCERTAGKKSYKEEVVKYFRHRWDNILDKHSVHAPTKCERWNA